MFLWDKPRGLRTFGLTPEFAAASKALAANQGLYNGFLAAGLVWGLALGVTGDSIKIFFLACILSPAYSVLSRRTGRSFGYRQFPVPLPWPWCYFREGAKPTSIHRGCRRIRRAAWLPASRGGARCEDKTHSPWAPAVARGRAKPVRRRLGSIVSNDVAYVIDCGNGVARQLVFAGVPLTRLRTSSSPTTIRTNNADYGNLILLAWTSGASGTRLVGERVLSHRVHSKKAWSSSRGAEAPTRATRVRSPAVHANRIKLP